MPETLHYSGELTVTTCWCGTRHAIPSELHDFQQRQHRDGRKVTAVYCPLGHTHVPAGESESERLQARLERERARNARLLAENDQLEASRNAYKGAATKARKRAKAGVCPCCNRTFQQLARHMASQHPDFDPELSDES